MHIFKMHFKIVLILSLFALTNSEKHLQNDEVLNKSISSNSVNATPTSAPKIDIGQFLNFSLPDFGSIFTKPTTTTISSISISTETTNSSTAAPLMACECGKRRNATISTSRSLKLESSVQDDDLTKIVNGTVSKKSEWPWTVAIVNVTASPKYARCGGSIISKDYILTAGHCMSGLTTAQLKMLRIYLGTNKINGNGTTPLVIPIGAYQVHPKFAAVTGTEVNNYDIAIIRLATPIPQFNRSITPVCLSQTGKPYVGKKVVATGWGDLFSGQQKGSNVLRQVPLTVIGNPDCNQTYSGIISPQMLCAVGVNPFKGTCQGDSGTGLYYLKPASKTYTLIGITSFGADCQRGGPPVFTRVSSVINFIQEYTMNRTTYCTNTFFP